MGVPRLYGTWFSKNLDNLLSRIPPDNVKTLSIDLNSIIHYAAQQVYGYGNFEGSDAEKRRRHEIALETSPNELEKQHIRTIIQKISILQNIIVPTEVMLIAVDGVAPFAKINQQRHRRYVSKMVGIFDPNIISPGTTFMINLDIEINKWLNNNIESMPTTTIYSSHNSPGEGEHKIMQYFREGKYFKENDVHVIYGNDTDFFMLSMLQSQKHIYLCRESFNNITNSYYKEYIDIYNLKFNILKNVKYIDNFVLITFLLGNDFLPSQPALKDMAYTLDLMIMCLQNIGTPNLIDKNNKINWTRFARFLYELGKYEYQLLKKEFNTDYRYPSTYHDLTGEFDFDKYRNEHYAFGFSILNLPPDANYEKSLSTMILIYFSGLQWIFDYYNKPIYEVNKNYYYRYPVTPLINDCLNYLDEVDEDKLDSVISRLINPNSTNPYLTTGLALLTMLPIRSQKLMRVPYTDVLVLDETNPLYQYYSGDHVEFSDGVFNEWQKRYLLPDMSAKTVINSLSNEDIKSIEDLYPVKEDSILIKATNTRLLRIERS